MTKLAALAVVACTFTPLPKLIEGIERKLHETPRAVAISKAGSFVTIVADDNTGEWTIIYTNTDGRSCIVDSGTDYESVTPQGPES